MVFNSGVFLYFVTIVFAVDRLLSRSGKLSLRNAFLLAASYFFYGYWDWIFLLLIFISTVVDYAAAILIEKSTDPRRRRLFLIVSMGMNLGILGTYKYYDFFAHSFVAAARSIHPDAFPDGGQSLLLNVILPVGISFYTFQTMSYTIDVYRKIIPAEKSLLTFALFVCYFPQLVAGPIERAGDLLTQLKRERGFDLDDAAKGAWLILLGFFMKVYVADSLGPLVDRVYLSGKGAYAANPALVEGIAGGHVIAASIAFAFQIYCDFAGYSSIALGTSLFFGVRLTENFNTPELSQNPGELWRRWHITLNRWVTDYIYIPLGGNRHGVVRKYRNLILAFTLMGLWHGANWTFFLWGLFHGSWLVLHEIFKTRLPRLPENAPPLLSGSVKVIKMVVVFSIFGLSATMFRAYDLHHTLALWRSMVSFPYETGAANGLPPLSEYIGTMIRIVASLLILDIMAYRRNGLFWIFTMPAPIRTAVYSAMFLTVIVMGVFGRDVIYFAF
jgi:D-alanyl-lipoteichoic acid acyltransferase DltB (MBOAT superfamily)